jgi:hypothetical protein
MTYALRDQACVVGIGHSRYGKRGELADDDTALRVWPCRAKGRAGMNT